MNLEAIYTKLCRSGNPGGEIGIMQDATLAALTRHLLESGPDSGVPALLLGMCEREAARRWLEDQQES